MPVTILVEVLCYFLEITVHSPIIAGLILMDDAVLCEALENVDLIDLELSH
jgi:hypothetical protein